MKSPINAVGGLVVAGALFLTAAAFAAAPTRTAIGKQPAQRPGSFTLSTTYSGIVGGSIRVGDMQYQISPSANIYVIGKGVVGQGFAVSNAAIYMSGKRVGLTPVVTQVLVRQRASAPERRAAVELEATPNPAARASARKTRHQLEPHSGSIESTNKGDVGVLPPNTPS
jgi:hypothetical protein